jgi:hypothetical protein
MAEHNGRRGHGRISEEIRRDIERTRADMDETVDALGERLSPGRVVDEVLGRLRKGDGLSSIGDVLRDHPVPVALMGLALSWLALERATMTERSKRAKDSVAHAGDEVARAGHDLAHAARKRVGLVSERVSELRVETSDKAEDLRERGLQTASHLVEGVREKAGQTRSSLADVLDRSPMAVGAIAFGLGLASGLMAPSSTAEDRLMGRVSDTLKDEAKRVAGETAASAKKVARATTSTLVDELRHAKHPEEGAAMAAVSDLKVVAGQVLDSAKETARESAEEAGLGVETLKREARSASARTSEVARERLEEMRRRRRG